jgi:hypothetical protein
MSDISTARPKSKQSITKSGIMPLPVVEPESKREASSPQPIPELRDDEKGTVTSVIPSVGEGVDSSAAREDDPAATH